MKKEDKKLKNYTKVYLLLFIIAILLWVIPSTISFITLENDNRAAELPQ